LQLIACVLLIFIAHCPKYLLISRTIHRYDTQTVGQ
jgi:hypothetical protein